MAMHHHVGVDDRRQLTVSDLIQHWDPTKKQPVPQQSFLQSCTKKIQKFNQSCNDYINGLPTWGKVAFYVTCIGIIGACVGLLFVSCDEYWRFRMNDSGFQTKVCRPIINVIDWCDTQSYWKPLVRIIEWLH